MSTQVKTRLLDYNATQEHFTQVNYLTVSKYPINMVKKFSHSQLFLLIFLL